MISWARVHVADLCFETDGATGQRWIMTIANSVGQP